MSIAKKVEPYNFDPSFERNIVLLLIFRARFYSRLGHSLETDAMGAESSKTVLKAVKLIAKESGTGPADPSILLQRLRRLQYEGQVTQEQIDEVLDLIVEAPKALPDEEAIVREATPLLRRRIEADAIRVAMDDYAKKGDMEGALRLIHQARGLGVQDLSVGLRIGEGSFEEIERMRQIDRLPTGIVELDTALDGGMARGCLGSYMGKTGGGKSMFLGEVAASSMRIGFFVLVATLEINRALWSARLKANLTGRPINEITRGDPTEVKKRIAAMYPVLGTCLVEYFQPKVTTVPHLIEWVKRCEEQEGYNADVIIVDMLSKCRSHDRNDQGNEYQGMGTVYETMRHFAESSGKWVWSAHHPRRAAGKEKNRRLDSEDGSDSQKIANSLDLLITGTKHGDEGDPQIEYFIAKNRYGVADIAIGPLPTDWECGRMTPRET